MATLNRHCELYKINIIYWISC